MSFLGSLLELLGAIGALPCDLRVRKQVITFFGDPLEEAIVSKALNAILAKSVYWPAPKIEWVVPKKTARIRIAKDMLNTASAGGTLQKIFADTKIDWIVQPSPPAPKKLLISDMDSTMIQQECIDELADFVGKKAHVAAITERAMNGELVFEDALRERVALLAGLPVEKLQQCFDERITAMGGAKELVAAFKKQGGKCVLVSGGFTFFTERVAKILGFDEHYANILEIENGKLTGTVRAPILGKEAKLSELHRQCTLLGIKPENVLAIGDGANDLPMLKTAGLGIAYHAKPVVQAQVKACINHGDLSGIQYLF